MKTTVDLPDDLARAVKVRAVEENRRLKDTIADLLRRGLAKEERRPVTVRRRLKLPLVECAHEARPTDERAKLACSLILGLDDDTAVETDPEIRKLWAAEAKRRYREYLEGKVELIPGEEAVRRARAAFGKEYGAERGETPEAVLG